MTFFYNDSESNIISVSDDFIVLKSIADNGDLTFQISFLANKKIIFEKSIFKINVTATSKTVKNVKITENGSNTNSEIIKNIINTAQNAYNESAQKNDFVLGSTKIDLSAYFDNSKIEDIEKGNFSSFSKKKLKNVLAKDLTEATPIFQQIAYQKFDNITDYISGTIAQNPSKLVHEMIESKKSHS